MLSCVAICRLQLYREMSVFVISPSASHIDTTALADGTYELIPIPKEVIPKLK